MASSVQDAAAETVVKLRILLDEVTWRGDFTKYAASGGGKVEPSKVMNT